MSHATPAGASADCNLLFGILALQMGFVTRDALLSGMHSWVFAKDRPLGELLQERRALTPQQRQVLDAVVAEHLKAHGGDVRRSLATAARPSVIDVDLESIADLDLQASLAAVGAALPPTDDLRPVQDGLRYHVLRPHARGGLGVVSVARDAELGREVALKEIDARHAADAASQGRFVREAEITGGLEHPGIVPVYGLGRYADGRPYYAMRFIRGESLQEALRKLHAGEEGYSLRGLLTRFVAVCNAVAYAHSRGVIHRDLKPSNVMLGSYGETLVVDWGLAKVIGRQAADDPDAGPAERTLQPPSGEGSATQAGSALGTPEYMSPEQARGELAALGPATDIYTLGATLYAVLTGRVAIPDRNVADVLEKVRQGNWPAPRQVDNSVPQALDAVCRKAMALEPASRYGTALELAADIERWLADEPVSAWREPWSTRARRWMRRHRPVVAGVAALLFAAVPLSFVIGVNLDQARRRAEHDAEEIRKQKDIAEANEKTATTREEETRAVLDFVENRILAAARPENQAGGLGHQVTLRRAIEAALPFVGQSFHDQPLVEARLRRTMGTSFSYLGNAKIAANQYEAARNIYTERLGADHPDTLKSMNNLAISYEYLGRHADALKLREETLALRKAKLGADHPDTLKSMNNLAISYDALGRHAEALKLHEETLALRKARLGADHPDTLKSMNNLAISYDFLGRHAEAHKLKEEALALYKLKLGPDHPDTLVSMNNLANSYYARGRHAEAVRLHEETLALRKAKLGPDHPDTLVSMNNLASSYHALGRYAEALKLHEEALTLRRAKLGPDHPDTLVSMYDLACCQTLMIAKSADPDKQAKLAMDCLRKAIAAGYSDIAQIKKDTDLDALRGRDDFNKLVADLERQAALKKE